MKIVQMVLALVFTLFAAQSASAQVSWGVFGGYNSSNLSTDVDGPIPVPYPAGGSEDGSFNSKSSFTVGGLLEYSLSPVVGLSIQPSYSQQGGEFVFDGAVVAPLSPVTRTKLGYFDVPVMLKVQLGSADVKPYLTSGFSLGFLTSAKSIGDGGTTDIKNSVKSTNASWIIGGGVNLPVDDKTFFLEGRYQMGLTDINEGPQPELLVATTVAVKTKGFVVVAGFSIPVG